MGSARPPEPERPAPAGALRDRLAMLLALATLVFLGVGFFLSKGTQVLMPGPLASAHGAIENCSACHTKSGSGKLRFLHGLVAGDPLADSKACLTCHKMPDTAFLAHGASPGVLEESTERLAKVAAQTPMPRSARAQSAAFPTRAIVARDLYCATCHQEHQGVDFKLSKISNEQCRSCHVVKFDSFDGDHPKFESFPFKRRTRIVYDHAGHFGKHYPELAQKEPTKRIPDTCATCHSSSDDRRIMAVAPFDKTCSGCHLDQIVGKERATGPKGIAFLSLPGLDLETLRKKNAAIGEWPDASEAALTPFMKAMIGRNERGRALLKTVDRLNLQDLTAASDVQLEAVTQLVWEIKGLFHALIKGKASDVLGDLNIGGGAKLSATLVSDLTASIPRDVVASAHQQWLPNLAAEMANRPVASDEKQGGWSPVISESKSNEAEGAAAKAEAAEAKPDGGEKARPTGDLPGAMRAGIKLAQNASPPAEPDADADGGAGPITGERLPLPSGTPRAIRALSKDAEQTDQPDGAAEESDGASTKADDGEKAPSSGEQPGATDARVTNPEQPAPPNAAKDDAAKAVDSEKAPSAGAQTQNEPTDQSDDLLFPTEEELRATKPGTDDSKKAAGSNEGSGKSETAPAKSDDTPKAQANAPYDAGAATGSDAAAASDTAAARPEPKAAPVISIESDVDPESWAEYGGWYRQDYAIYYRPVGHKDKFVYSWLFLTGPQAPKGDRRPAAAIFDSLTGKDAQGSCTKCHSIDDIPGKGRVVNFSPPSAASKLGRFTTFIHEPHFGILENRGCLTCHNLEKGRPYLKSYEQGNPQSFASNFGEVKKDLCQSCHTASKARQDCMLCHKYHVNGVSTPIINTKLPAR